MNAPDSGPSPALAAFSAAYFGFAMRLCLGPALLDRRDHHLSRRPPAGDRRPLAGPGQRPGAQSAPLYPLVVQAALPGPAGLPRW